jgi:hypothetical protein
MSKNIPQVRTWRATFYGFGNLKLGSVTVQAPTKYLARFALYSALRDAGSDTREAWEKCSRITWGALRTPRCRRCGHDHWTKDCHRYGQRPDGTLFLDE